MAQTMQFDLVSPERALASVQASAVQIPGADGDLTAMPDHAPTITTLRPGVLTVEGPEGTQSYAVTGGFADINAQGTSVLAEKAIPTADITAADMDALIALASEAVETAAAENKDVAAKNLADLEALRAALNV
ncbi:F0F1 ATP synthase subunit epsilon [Cognatishimia sp. SS12]|uniref:F0F1 ATP synthase subunit epsilon n=1 Tax=Cognatishimia sp. SS12 TaxID=2979465 RepID=UPI00232CE00D|nr:F0F1 ATP synthase subunit epsilon [Cognatishimia sp. SS12]MDC0738850.1 F0F1 ATP synthase subunit epsilon [Cognatishimia sp. SS12]